MVLLTPKCPRPFLNFLEFALNWIKCQYFDKFYQLNFFLTIQFQTRHVRDHMGKENTIISLMGWKIIMFDYEGVKTMKANWSLSILSSYVKSKIKGHRKIWV